jgi:hypothetical protein
MRVLLAAAAAFPRLFLVSAGSSATVALGKLIQRHEKTSH